MRYSRHAYTDADPSSSFFLQRGPPPSLSLSLPPTFVRSQANLRLLEGLLTTLSQHYVVTLIVPPPSSVGSASTSQAIDHGIESVAELSDALRHVAGFDERRVLEYSKEEGRLALARALACDAHCEVMLQPYADGADDGLFFGDEDEEDAQTEDGDKTPRATSPHPGTGSITTGKSPDQKQQSEEAITALERYHAEVSRIRKSSALLIFLILPVSRRSLSHAHQRNTNGTQVAKGSQSDVWSLDVESVLKPFLMPGQRDLSARVPGVKIVDARLPVAVNSIQASPQQQPKPVQRNDGSSTTSTAQAWTEAAHRLGHFADGWS